MIMGGTSAVPQNGTLFSTPLTERQKINSEMNHLDYTQGKTRVTAFPRRIVFELTNRCNFRCIMCGREAADFRAYDLPLSVIERFEPFLPYVEEVTLHGWGEGTLHRDFAGIVAFLNRFPSLRKYFVTNGSTLDGIRDLIFEHHIDLVALSLDGATAATNDSIRVNGSFERQIASIRSLLEEKKRRGADYPYVNFVLTAMRRNFHELPEMVELAASLGVPEVKSVYLTIFTPELACESLLDCQEEIRPVFAEARRRAAQLRIKIKLPEIQGEGEAGTLRHKRCPLPWRDLYIGSDGNIRPCQSSAQQLGSVYEWEAFEDIWNAPATQEFRRRVNNEEEMSPCCFHCYHSSCANYNLPHAFLQLQQDFAPTWEQPDARPSYVPDTYHLPHVEA